MKIKKDLPESRLAYRFILPSAIVMALITVYPLLYGVWMAFTNFSPRHIRNQDPEFVGLQNFIDILGQAPYLDFSFLSVLGFNFVWTFANLIFHVSLGVALALLINTPGLRGKRAYRALLILPWAVPTYVTALIWKNMFDTQFGAVNLLLKEWQQAVPFLPTNVDWLGQFPNAFYAVLLVNIWMGFPFMMMVASGALQSIPSDLYEAADMDGAGPWRKFWTVTVPMLKPAMVPAIMLGFIWTFNNFNVIYFVTQGNPFGKTEILVTQAYKLVDMGMYGQASAFALIIFFILLAFTLVNLKVTKATQEV
jgi:arabinogalactan oligomer/maltooligosaccharide transport system permease protein